MQLVVLLADGVVQDDVVIVLILVTLHVLAPVHADQLAEPVVEALDETLVLEVLELDEHTDETLVPKAQTGVGVALMVVQLEVTG